MPILRTFSVGEKKQEEEVCLQHELLGTSLSLSVCDVNYAPLFCAVLSLTRAGYLSSVCADDVFNKDYDDGGLGSGGRLHEQGSRSLRKESHENDERPGQGRRSRAQAVRRKVILKYDKRAMWVQTCRTEADGIATVVSTLLVFGDRGVTWGAERGREELTLCRRYRGLCAGFLWD